MLIEVPTTQAAPTGGTAAFAQDTDSVSTFQQKSNRSSRRKLPLEPTATKQAPKKTPPQRAATNQEGQAPDDRSLESHASALTMETLESTVQQVVQQVFETQMAQVIQQAIANSMQQMHGLAVSANTQRESEVPQNQENSSGKSHERTADDESFRGGPSGASAQG